MSLATRCPACATVFRVVQDQLRVSEGWVRCGRCGEVFNAGLALVNLDGTPRQVAPPPPPPASTAPPPRPAVAQPATPAAAPPVTAATSLVRTRSDTPLAFIEPQPDFEPTQPPPAHDLNPVSRALNARGEPEFVVSDYEPPSVARVGDTHDDELDRIDLESLSRRALQTQEAAAAAAAPPAAPPPETPKPAPPPPIVEPVEDQATAGDFMLSAPMPPSFVQTADRAARWQQPGMRRILWFVSALGVLALCMQAAIEYRAVAVARWPVLRPALTQLCQVAGCSVDSLRQIESLAVESSGLVRIDGTALYRLSVVLRNKAALELAAPSFDLSLTDAQGKLIARRVLSLADLGVAARTLAGGSELSVQAAVGVGDRAVAGYTVEIFYP